MMLGSWVIRSVSFGSRSKKVAVDLFGLRVVDLADRKGSLTLDLNESSGGSIEWNRSFSVVILES